MSNHPLDAPAIRHNLFHVRKTPPHTHPDTENIKDGFIKIDDRVQLGYRLYRHTPTAPVILYFHGNGEIATDYESIAPFYHLSGASLLVVDYRGYGWSSGVPLTSTLLPDARMALNAVDHLLAEQGVAPGCSLFVKGRSLGSAPAIYLALKDPHRFKGLMIESGYAEAPSLFRRLGIPVPAHLTDEDDLPIYNARKMQQINLPLLVIHGEADVLIPASNGEELYNASPSQQKELILIAGAGHNNLLSNGIARYFDAIKRFIETYG